MYLVLKTYTAQKEMVWPQIVKLRVKATVSSSFTLGHIKNVYAWAGP